MIKRVTLIFSFVLAFVIPKEVFCQQNIIVDSVEVQLCTLSAGDSISIPYVYIKSPNETNKTLVFLQGSGPRPLFVQEGNDVFCMLPLDIKKIVQSSGFNLVMLAPPGLNSLEDISSLDQQFFKMDQQGFPNDAYRKGNNLENLAERYNKVMRHVLRSNPHTDFYLFGHSQGSRIAAALGNRGPHIQKIALSSVNPMGRRYERVSHARAQHILGKITFAEAQSIIDSEYEKYKDLNNASARKTLEDFSELSFLSPTLSAQMITLHQPVLMIYGSHDFGISFEADKIMFAFLSENKRNLNLKVYDGMDHNFFIGEQMNWDLILSDTMKWFDE